MATYKSVGWLVPDPFDETSPPMGVAVTVEAETRDEASEKAREMLRALHPEMELLDWYTRDTDADGALRDEADWAIEGAALAAGWQLENGGE